MMTNLAILSLVTLVVAVLGVAVVLATAAAVETVYYRYDREPPGDGCVVIPPPEGYHEPEARRGG